MDLDKLVLEAGVSLRGEPVASIGEPGSDARTVRQGQAHKHPQHANHIGYVLQTQDSLNDNWYWWEGDEPVTSYTFEQAQIIIKEKQLDWPKAKFRIVGIVGVS